MTVQLHSAPGPDDTPSGPATPDTALDELAAVAALVCGTPVAFIHLLDADGGCRRGRAGLAAGECPLDAGGCTQARGEEVVIVADARAEPAFRGRAFGCGEGDLRFCASAPLPEAEGRARGVLCVADYRPRTLTAEQRGALRTLGHLAVAQQELRRRVDELAHAEAAARESYERFRIVAKATVDAVWDWDLASNSLWWNEAVTTLFGYAADAVEPTVAWWTGHIHPEERARVLADMRAAIEGDATGWHEEYRFLRADGSYAHIYDRAYLIRDAAGRPLRMVGAMQDVTERVRIEQMMVQTEKMMSVGGLAAGMAHEINNPLGVILQSCQNLRRRLGPELAANRRVAEQVGLDLDALQRYLQARGLIDFVEAIQEAGTRAGRIVADMLAFSRRADARFEPVRVDAMLDAVLRLTASDYDLKKQYDFKQVEIVRRYDAALPPVPCARTEIEQVLLNLLKNAAQAMAEGGARPSRLVLRTAREDGFARIDIEDNGPGIDAAMQRRIFEPFFTTKPVGIGTGLGLSVSYFIITDHHRGRIEVESTPGEGTRFTIRLPLQRQEAA